MTVQVGYYQADSRTRELVRGVLDRGRISHGPLCKELEDKFAQIHESKYAVLSSSGTDSLRAALHALKIIHGWPDGSEIIVPATTFVATLNIVLQVGLKPILIDVDKDTYCIDPDLIQDLITLNTVGIIPVNLLGQPAPLERVRNLAQAYELSMIEDSCEAMFVKHKGRSVGAWGDIGCFSFYMAHLITSGVGGVAITNNAEYADVMRSLLNHGRDTIYVTIDDDNDLSDSDLANVVVSRFRFKYPGYSSRMTELQAALALPQLYDWQDMIAKRRNVAEMLNSALAKFSNHIQLPSIGYGNEHSWMMFGLVTKNETKNKLVLHLERDGIETRDLLPLINQPAYDIDRSKYPQSSYLIDHGFYIGSHQGMTEDDVKYVERSFEAYYKDKE